MSDAVQLGDDRLAEGPAKVPLKIFINYRHEDMPFAASTLYRELKGRFGRENIFFDEGTLRPGTKFLEEIKSQLADAAGAFIALIGSKWMPIMMTHRRRGDKDYVTMEIELALEHGWTVIPVLVDDAGLPDPLQLPPAIRSLPERHVARLRQTNLDGDVEDLSARLNEIRDRKNDKREIRDHDKGEADPTGYGQTKRPGKPPAVDPHPGHTGQGSAPEVSPADDEHYRALAEEAGNLVVFLGAAVNSDDYDGPFQEGTATLPDDMELAKYLATKVRLESGLRDLAEVAQYIRMTRGESSVFRWVRQLLKVDSEPGPVHKYLARLPRRFEELGLGKRYQMIVTPKLDLALEQAFREEGEPFDVAVYMAPGTEHAGRFVHLPWGHVDSQPVLTNDYEDFPFIADTGELTRTVIVRINGAIDDPAAGYPWKDNLVITEDHYIDYLGGLSPEEIVPSQILAKLIEANYLFLGYTMADWRLRIFLHRIWKGDRPRRATYWAVEREPDALERQFWQRSGICLYRNRLADYVTGLDRFLTDHRDELLT